VLQIVQGKYFRDVPLTDTLHRGILYTNLRAFGDREAHNLLFGRILPSTNFDGVASLTVEAREQLESVNEIGGQEVLAATSGDQLIDEIAAVVAFCLNAVCVRDYYMAQRVISKQHDKTQNYRGPASILRQTFDASIVMNETSIQDVDAFVRQLTGLQRRSYEAAMRAIRQIIDATLMVDEDATLAYTLMVAALESLGQRTEPRQSKWIDLGQEKRTRIDDALDGLDDDRTERIQSAILANEHTSLQRRFVSFVLDHVEPSFYRREAVSATRPISAADLPAALNHAYAIRSRNVHTLENLAPEVWMASYGADTAHVDGRTLLSLEGLARLARHVVRRFVERGPTGVDSSFNYRAALPNIIQGQMAPQYWIHQAAGFNTKRAPAYLEGMIEFMIGGIANQTPVLVDMTPVLQEIERSALGLTKWADRLPMAGIMTLWNARAPEAMRRVLRPKLEALFESDLAQPSMVSFAVNLVLGVSTPWKLDAMHTLANERITARLKGNAEPMPRRIDGALHLLVGDQLLAQGDRDAGLAEIAHAVETVPGLGDLIKYEDAMVAGEPLFLELSPFVLGAKNFLKASRIDEDADVTGASDA
jgi:hypothetical protein